MKPRVPLIPAAAALILLVIGAFLAAGFWMRASRPGVAERWSIFVEHVSPEKKLLALSSTQRYAASKEFTARLLSLVNVKAVIELEALAEVFYVVDASDSSRWAISWDRRARALSVSAPEPDCLPPSVRTDTIEIRTRGGNLLTNTVFRLKEEARKMEDELSADLMARARLSLQDSTVREGVRVGLAGIAASFCEASLGVKPASVTVRLPGDP